MRCSVELRLIDIYNVYFLKVYVGALSLHYEALSVEASKQTTAEEIVSCIVERLGLPVRILSFVCSVTFCVSQNLALTRCPPPPQLTGQQL